MEKKTNHKKKERKEKEMREAKEEEKNAIKIEELKSGQGSAETELLIEQPHDAKNLLIILGVIMGVLALIFAGVALYNHYSEVKVVDVDQLHQENLQNKLDEKEGYMYEGFSFVKVDGLWWSELNMDGEKVKVPLHFGPKEVESVEIKGELSPMFNQGDEVYIAIDPKVVDKFYTLALSELSFNVVKGLKRTPIGSCTEEDWACDNRTIISCNNNPKYKPVIELAIANETSIELIGSCIKISGSGYNITRATDRVLYQWYGVMKMN